MSSLPTPLSTFSRPHAHSTPSAHFPLKRSPPSLPSLSRSHSSSSSMMTVSASASMSASTPTSPSPKTPEQSFEGEQGGDIKVEGEGEGGERGEGEDDFADFIWSPSPSSEDRKMFKPLPLPLNTISSSSSPVVVRSSTATTTRTTTTTTRRRPPFKRRDTPIPLKSSLPSNGDRFSYPSEGFTTTLTTSPIVPPFDLQMSSLNSIQTSQENIVSSSSSSSSSSRKQFIASLKNETIEKWRFESRPDVFEEDEENEIEVNSKRQSSWMSVVTGDIWLEV